MNEKSSSVPRTEISVAATLLRTVVLVGLTLALTALVRFWPAASHGVQRVAGSSAWQSLYGLFHIESALGREQLILIAIVLACFVLALAIQLVGLLILSRWRRRSPSLHAPRHEGGEGRRDPGQHQ